MIKEENLDVEELPDKVVKKKKKKIPVPNENDEILSDFSEDDYYKGLEDDIEDNIDGFNEKRMQSAKNKKLTAKENKKLKRKENEGKLDGIETVKTEKDADDEDEIDKDDYSESDDDILGEDDDDDDFSDNPLRSAKMKKKEKAKNGDEEEDVKPAVQQNEEDQLSDDTEEEIEKSKKKKNAKDNLMEEEDEKKNNKEYDTDDKAEIRAIAKKMLRKKNRLDIFYKSYNRYAFDDTEDAPKWFAEDEQMHNKPQKPVTKEEIMKEKEELREINTKLPKKVLEAKNRKKMKIAKRMQKVKQKAQVIVNQDEINEHSKISQIEKLYRRELSKSKERKRYVVGKKSNKGPTKGGRNVKFVDRRMKKEKRADKARGKRKKGRSNK